MATITETLVANRALQRVGNDPVTEGSTLWTDTSRGAKQIRRCYEIDRRSELRRNVWRFSIRSLILRPLTDDSRLVMWMDWRAGTVTTDEIDYAAGDIVMGSDGQLWKALIDQPYPSTDPTLRVFATWAPYIGSIVAQPWDDETTWMAGDLVYAGTEVYVSIVNDNVDNAVSDTNFWFKYAADALQTNPTLTAIAFDYPIGSGPNNSMPLKNVYRLPYGWVREAPQSPKQGSYMPMGAPSLLGYTDWNYEGDYITTVNTGPLAYRFASDIQDPAKWDPMFVDSFSARLALDVCEPLTQSTNKIGAIGNAYIKFIGEARTVNGIETGSVEPPEDTYITCRN